MIQVTSFESLKQSRSHVPAALKAAVAVPTLIVEHSDCDELLWALRLTEFFGDISRGFGYQPNVQWREESEGVLCYEDSEVAPEDCPSGTCSCQVNSKDDILTFEIGVTNRSNEVWPDCWGWLCFIHCWAQAFQATCELPVG